MPADRALRFVRHRRVRPSQEFEPELDVRRAVAGARAGHPSACVVVKHVDVLYADVRAEASRATRPREEPLVMPVGSVGVGEEMGSTGGDRRHWEDSMNGGRQPMSRGSDPGASGGS
jgi:hypothetical protein